MISRTIGLALGAVAVTVTAPAVHAISTTPTSLSFGTCVVLQTATQELTIENTEGGMLTVDSLVFTGPGFGSTAPVPFNVANSSKTIQITFTPTSRGSKIGTLTIVSSDHTTPRKVVNLSGTGVAPIISAPASLDFGGVVVGDGANRSLVVTNTSTDTGQTLMVSDISFTGADASMFALTGTILPPQMIIPGGHVTFSVRFSPTSTGAKLATASLSSNDPFQPTRTASLTGNADMADVEVGGAPLLALARPSPNPARGEVTFDFGLPKAGLATLAVFDTQGRRVRTLVRGACPAGRRTVRWNRLDDAGRAVRDGIYLVRLEASGRQSRAVRFTILH